jgi:predicted PurR-regulated permease PerM
MTSAQLPKATHERDAESMAGERDAVLRRWGNRGWSFAGIAAAAFIVYIALASISGLVMPLIIATVIAAIFVPVVDRFERYMPRYVAAAAVLVLLAVATAAMIALAIDGVIDQAGEIGRQLANGYDVVADWLDDIGIQVGNTDADADAAVDSTAELWSAVVPGLASYVGTVFSGTAAFMAGAFVALFLLYFLLADWKTLIDWLAGRLGVDQAVGAAIIQDSTWAMRQYFAALTASSLVVAVIVGGTAALLGIPLVFVIAVVTFMTSYVPYIGAIFSGAFAVLIALGAGGPVDAAIMLAVVLIAQNVVQAIVHTKLTEGRLSLHPIVIFGSTIAGGAIFGLLGAAVSTPIVAISILVSRRLRDAQPVEATTPTPNT